MFTLFFTPDNGFFKLFRFDENYKIQKYKSKLRIIDSIFESNVKSVFQKKTIIINDEVNRYYELKDGIRNIIIVDYQS